MKAKTHYNIDEIEKRGALINLIWGERSNGKSYQVKHKMGVLPYLNGIVSHLIDLDSRKLIEREIKKGSRFILLRRWKEETTTEKIEQYFSDIDIEKLTDGKYNTISVYRKSIFLAKFDSEKGSTKRYDKIGYVMALSTEQNYAGASYLDVDNIIFEEFMSRSAYIADEPNKLMNLWSTVDRKRGTTRMWLVGNTISRVCPYIQDWGLDKIVSKQKQGDIDIIYLSTGTYNDDGIEIKVPLAIEYCRNTTGTNYIIGTHKDMLNKGSWQSDPQPHLPKSLKEYETVFRIGFMYKSFKFLGDLLLDNTEGTLNWYIYPYSGEFNKTTIIFSDIIKTSSYWQRDIYNPTIRNDRIKDLLKTFKENKIFYASDLCGTDFKQVIDFEIKK